MSMTTFVQDAVKYHAYFYILALLLQFIVGTLVHGNGTFSLFSQKLFSVVIPVGTKEIFLAGHMYFGWLIAFHAAIMLFFKIWMVLNKMHRPDIKPEFVGVGVRRHWNLIVPMIWFQVASMAFTKQVAAFLSVPESKVREWHGTNAMILVAFAIVMFGVKLYIDFFMKVTKPKKK